MITTILSLIREHKYEEARGVILYQIDKDRYLENMRIKQYFAELPNELFENRSYSDYTDTLTNEVTPNDYISAKVALTNNFTKENLRKVISIMEELREQKYARFMSSHSPERLRPEDETFFSENLNFAIILCVFTLIVSFLIPQ